MSFFPHQVQFIFLSYSIFIHFQKHPSDGRQFTLPIFQPRFMGLYNSRYTLTKENGRCFFFCKKFKHNIFFIFLIQHFPRVSQKLFIHPTLLHCILCCRISTLIVSSSDYAMNKINEPAFLFHYRSPDYCTVSIVFVKKNKKYIYIWFNDLTLASVWISSHV